MTRCLHVVCALLSWPSGLVRKPRLSSSFRPDDVASSCRKFTRQSAKTTNLAMQYKICVLVLFSPVIAMICILVLLYERIVFNHNEKVGVHVTLSKIRIYTLHLFMAVICFPLVIQPPSSFRSIVVYLLPSVLRRISMWLRTMLWKPLFHDIIPSAYF